MAESSTLARPYAKAAFDYALEHGDLAQWSRQLGTVAAVVAVEPVAKAIDSPSLTGDAQAQLLLDLCGDELSPAVNNFLRVLAENKRLQLLDEIAAQFELYKANQEKSVDVDVTTAYPLEQALEQQLTAALKGKLQREISLNTNVDQSLLGGVLVRAGDVVIDGSVRGRLAKLARAMNS